MLIAQVSDAHVCAEPPEGEEWPAANLGLAAAVRHLCGLLPAPDLVLMTGDLTRDGTDEEYRALRALIAPLPMPVHLMPGNHDNRERLQGAFPDHAYLPVLTPSRPFLHYVLELELLRLVVLDTVAPGKVSGELCPARLGWLARQLAQAPDHPTVIAMHHPPMAVGIRGMDALACDHHGVLPMLLRRHSQVGTIICGHLHRAMSVHWEGVTVTSCPSTWTQVGLALGDGMTYYTTSEPPALRLHWWEPGCGFVSHLSYIGSFSRRPL